MLYCAPSFSSHRLGNIFIYKSLFTNFLLFIGHSITKQLDDGMLPKKEATIKIIHQLILFVKYNTQPECSPNTRSHKTEP